MVVLDGIVMGPQHCAYENCTNDLSNSCGGSLCDIHHIMLATQCTNHSGVNIQRTANATTRLEFVTNNSEEKCAILKREKLYLLYLFMVDCDLIRVDSGGMGQDSGGFHWILVPFLQTPAESGPIPPESTGMTRKGKSEGKPIPIIQDWLGKSIKMEVKNLLHVRDTLYAYMDVQIFCFLDQQQSAIKVLHNVQKKLQKLCFSSDGSEGTRFLVRMGIL
ncbi:uncharacterized protein LACBIDRAFT_331913 [Laccaria bicolor S238N-H82]|uniref:Predicted protein n=1 Tax=Laccaria bicolor (strain S238N-H82 / ATCC MYA-4686) TaxID=486041 RepID=B0DR11_LACBS|nr:uncharacterized protein LACBIDRAFT_331913 [Laccaria bicolor S238N-H82]EDR02918.1 predicted protein [Laccaria bicolor S238N-H82]|eukprot:XP_001886341.1 predicted protein [Laccaria bicolor S238N-H82]